MGKFGNRKTVVDGITFDSAKEARRYQELKLLERAGAISDFERQVAFELLPTQRRDGKVIERPVKYVADFVYMENGQRVVEDVKGLRTKEYVLKRKMMLWRHGVRVKEI